MTFGYMGVVHDLFDHPYNTTILNERAVEVAVANHWLDNMAETYPSGEGLEVGNVMSHYGRTGHRVVDLTEVADGVENLDVFEVRGSYDWVLAISTIEHVYWDNPIGRSEGMAAMSLNHLVSLLKPGGSLLVTVPTGYHPPLDQYLLDERWLDFAVTIARTAEGGWRQTPKPEVRPYGPWANSVWLIEHERAA